MAPLPIAIVVDVDPDWRIPERSGTPSPGGVSWRGLTEGIPRLLRVLEPLKDSEGKSVRFTWLLRSDEQIATLTGNPASLADEFADFWRSRAKAGDEIGWHPHLWRYSEQDRNWFQETSDVDWIRDCLRDGYSALSQRFQIRTAKSGWTFHSNETMRIFSDLGLQSDVSALPGMSYTSRMPGFKPPFGTYDWDRAPQEPYHPRRDDYQTPGDGDSLPILELPNWTFPVGRLRGFLHSPRGRSQRDFCNPAKSPSLSVCGFAHPPFTTPFVCYFHPEELLGPNYLFRAENVARNLMTLLSSCDGNRMQPKFCTTSEAAAGWSRVHGSQ